VGRKATVLDHDQNHQFPAIDPTWRNLAVRNLAARGRIQDHIHTNGQGIVILGPEAAHQ
jgi:hypothetical protein